MPNCYAKPGGPSVAKMADHHKQGSKGPAADAGQAGFWCDGQDVRDRYASASKEKVVEEKDGWSAPIGNFPPFWEFMTDRPTNQPTDRQGHRKISLPIVYGIPV